MTPKMTTVEPAINRHSDGRIHGASGSCISDTSQPVMAEQPTNYAELTTQSGHRVSRSVPSE
jgi:hypothetical protein